MIENSLTSGVVFEKRKTKKEKNKQTKLKSNYVQNGDMKITSKLN